MAKTKTLRNKILTAVNVVLSFFMTFLGFSCCRYHREFAPIHDDYPVHVEYGCPYSQYIAEGYVFDEQHAFIEGIRILVKPSDRYGFRFADTLMTDTVGRYGGRVSGELATSFDIIAEDPNGVFESDTVSNVRVVQEGRRGNLHWDNGVYKITQNFNLKKKQ